MSTTKIYKNEPKSRRSTEEDSASEKDEEAFYLKTNPAKHKT